MDMDCPKCKRMIPDDAVLCCYCGKKLQTETKKNIKRPNGTGNVYRRGTTWTARVVDHYEYIESGDNIKYRPVWKTKGGFKTKRDAINYIPTLKEKTLHAHNPETMERTYERWKERYEGRVSAKTMEGYKGAYKHLSALHKRKMDSISAVELQDCLDGMDTGKRSRQLVKVFAGLLFKFAIDDNQIFKNPAANLYVGEGEVEHYEPLNDDELKKIEESNLPYSDYVVALCYLGHRPTELWGFTKADYHEEGDVHYLSGGIKTEAGKNRTVTIPPKVLPIIQARVAVEGTNLLVPRLTYSRKGEFKGYVRMDERYFNKFIWKPMMDKLGIVGKVPYATRHTYANKMKAVTGDEKDKASLMGHASYETTRKHYQSTSLEEQKKITDQL